MGARGMTSRTSSMPGSRRWSSWRRRSRRSPPRDLIACRFPLLDGVGNRPELLALAVRTVAGLLAAEVPTLVCCSAGMSRSLAVLAAVLAWVNHEPPQDCLKRIAAHHPSDVSPGLWKEVASLTNQDFAWTAGMA